MAFKPWVSARLTAAGVHSLLWSSRMELLPIVLQPSDLVIIILSTTLYGGGLPDHWFLECILKVDFLLGL